MIITLSVSCNSSFNSCDLRYDKIVHGDRPDKIGWFIRSQITQWLVNNAICFRHAANFRDGGGGDEQLG